MGKNSIRRMHKFALRAAYLGAAVAGQPDEILGLENMAEDMEVDLMDIRESAAILALSRGHKKTAAVIETVIYDNERAIAPTPPYCRSGAPSREKPQPGFAANSPLSPKLAVG